MVKDELSSNARKVQQALEAQGLPCQVVELPSSTRTAMEAAQSIGCEVGQIVKSLVFREKESGLPVLVETSGSNRVDEGLLAALCGSVVEKASAEFVRERTGFSIGGVPPLAHDHPIKAFIDEDLLQYAEIWAAAGTPHAVFRLAPSDLVRITGGKTARIRSG
jgi:prolyl-tRNA editing enzyme YbaK/EbsC (Cys-tRNA(Pro) deacylase)